MIEVKQLTKRFGKTAALDGLSIKIPTGSVYGLVGPNGSGKSTLLRHIAGVYRPDAGEVLVDGEPVFENTAAKGKVFFLPDDLWFLPRADLREMARFYQGVYPSFDREVYDRLCQALPIDPEKKISGFSKGQRRQAALLLALSCRTQYLLLDEAFDGLDPVLRLMVKKLLAQEIEGRRATVVVSSHDLRELEDLCDHIGLLYQGGIRLERELDELKQGFCKVQLVSSQPVDWEQCGLDILRRQQRGTMTTLVVRGGADQVESVLEGYNPVFLETMPLTLEEIFIEEMEAAGYDYDKILA